MRMEVRTNEKAAAPRQRRRSVEQVQADYKSDLLYEFTGPYLTRESGCGHAQGSLWYRL